MFQNGAPGLNIIFTKFKRHKVKIYCFTAAYYKNKCNTDDNVAIYKVQENLLPGLKVQNYGYLLYGAQENKMRVNFENSIIFKNI